MKNKKLTYVLIALVALLWGAIIYKIVSAYTQDDNDIEPTETRINKEPYNDYNWRKDTTELNFKYRDPFGVTARIDTPKVRSPALQISKKSVTMKQDINWGFIKYTGYIRNPASKKLIAIMNINGNSVMLSENESANEVKLLKVQKDSVKVFYKNRSKFIKMN